MKGGVIQLLIFSVLHVLGTTITRAELLPGDLLVSSYYNEVVLRFGSDGSFIETFADEDSGLNYPTGIALGSDGAIYVSNYGGNNIQRYTSDANASYFAIYGGIERPRGIAFFPDGRLIVSNYILNEILSYGADGSRLGALVQEDRYLSYPYALVIGPGGDIFVTSATGNAVYRYDGTDGSYKGEFASGGGLNKATGLAFGTNGDLFVCSEYSSQVLRYDGVTGEFIGVFVSSDDLYRPVALAFGHDGDLFVTTGATIRRFDGVSGSFKGDFASGSATCSDILFITDPADQKIITLRSGAHGQILEANYGGDYVSNHARGAAFPLARVQPAPGYKHVGWSATLPGVALSDFEATAVYQALPLFDVTFRPGAHGSIVGADGSGRFVQTVEEGLSAAAPDVVADSGWTFIGWDVSIDEITENLDAIAEYQLAALVPKGSGTQSDPFRIESRGQFDEFCSDTRYWEAGVYTRLDVDLNLSDTVYEQAPIAPDLQTTDDFQGIPFSGVFDGNGRTIRNLTIDSLKLRRDYLGLFGLMQGAGAQILNLTLEGGKVSGGYESRYLGGLCGYNDTGLIESCYSGVEIEVDEFYSYWLGGLCGINEYGTIRDCGATGRVSTKSACEWLGGLCGGNSYGTIERCFATGDVSTLNGWMLAGLAGISYGGDILESYSTGNVSGGRITRGGGFVASSANDTIRACYSTGSVTVNEDSSWIGGFMGINTESSVVNCYATGLVSTSSDDQVGAFVGRNIRGDIQSSFWNRGTAGRSTGAGYTTPWPSLSSLRDLTSAQMFEMVHFYNVGWDFFGESQNGDDDRWIMGDRPLLRWSQSGEPDRYVLLLHPGANGDIVGANAGDDYIIALSPEQSVPSISALPDDGYYFTSWNPTLPSNLSGNLEATALFKMPIAVPLEATVNVSDSLNVQTGLLEQEVMITNDSTTATLSDYVVTISDMPQGTEVYNANDLSERDFPKLHFTRLLPPGESFTFVIEYYQPMRNTNFTPVITVELGDRLVVETPSGEPTEIAPTLTFDDGRRLLEFPTTPGNEYLIQYSPDMNTWTTVLPSLRGVATSIQWIDSGPPKTFPHPDDTIQRFYRIYESEPVE